MPSDRRAFLRSAWLLAAAACTAARGQAADPSRSPPAGKGNAAQDGFEPLLGKWVRLDGNYRITIRSASAVGRLDASYANPTVLPFALAQATREGGALKAYFLLRAGGYNGSTYTLTYDAGKDILKGIYFQATSGERYEVQFVRARF